MSRGLTLALLAAGSASRFGGGKLDAVSGGGRVGRGALDALLALDLGKPLIVVGDMVPRFAREAEELGLAELLHNPLATRGIGTSVAHAARRAGNLGSELLLLTLADMPLVSPDTLRKLLDNAAPNSPSALRQRDGHPGVPACFPADWFARLRRLGGDQGAGALLRKAAKHVRLIHALDQELTDIDRPEDLMGG